MASRSFTATVLSKNRRFYDWEFADCHPLLYNIIRSAQEHEFMSIARRFCHQLLSLGYGRRELHPGDLPVRDEHLKYTRRSVKLSWSHESEAFIRQRQSELQHRKFDAGPLTLQQRVLPFAERSAELTSPDVFVRSPLSCRHLFSSMWQRGSCWNCAFDVT